MPLITTNLLYKYTVSSFVVHRNNATGGLAPVMIVRQLHDKLADTVRQNLVKVRIVRFNTKCIHFFTI